MSPYKLLALTFGILTTLVHYLFVGTQVYAAGNCTYQGGSPSQCVDCGSAGNSGGVNGSGASCTIANYTTALFNTGSCKACEGIDGSGRYLYRTYVSDATKTSSACSYNASYGSLVPFLNPQNSDVNTGGCYWAPLPGGCNNGYGTETCESGGGGGGQCGVEAQGPGSCPDAYVGRDCSEVPCGQRDNCFCPCSCDGSCQESGGQCEEGGGGGPTATPTPTPTPYCTLTCPGGGSSGSGGSGVGVGSGGSGVGDSGGSGSTITPPYASGNISYAGYNGFACSTFDNGSDGVGACPSGGGGGGSGEVGSGGSESWSQAATFNMLCGEQPHTYTAEVVGGSSGGGIGANPTSTPAPGTPTPTPTTGLYPQGCSLGGGTPTPSGRGSGGGAIGSEGGSLSCSCSVTLGCQTSLEPPASDPSQESGTCNPGVCDFTVSPDFATFNNELTFTVDHASSLDQNSFNFSDNSGSHDIGEATSTTHTFVNAGVYPVTLTCSNGSTSIDCTRRVNAYCNNGIVPTATPTPAPISSWFKLKNTAFSREGAITNTIPATATSFDIDDDGICEVGQPAVRACMVSGAAGSTLSEGALSLGSGTSSSTGWQKTNTVLVKRFTPTSFRDYALARKETNTITDMADIQAGVINKFSGNLTVSNADFSGFTEDFVLLVDGDLTVTDSLTNTTNISAAFIVTDTLNIESAAGELNGIFVTTNVNLSSDTTPSTTPLKIVGNLVSVNPGDTTQRARTDTDKPSLFVSGDSTKYLRLIGLLGISTYDQEEIAQ